MEQRFCLIGKANKKYMCVYGHPTHPIFQPPTLTFFIDSDNDSFGSFFVKKSYLLQHTSVLIFILWRSVQKTTIILGMKKLRFKDFRTKNNEECSHGDIPLQNFFGVIFLSVLFICDVSLQTKTELVWMILPLTFIFQRQVIFFKLIFFLKMLSKTISTFVVQLQKQSLYYLLHCFNTCANHISWTIFSETFKARLYPGTQLKWPFPVEFKCKFCFWNSK
jgi:hypothetical protein